ncbi:MAG: hypothetical protein JWM20_536 [Patescibacteria group bacterium]|nr:hypothetical protein [Patescibacteria group bacterium]
MNRKTFHKGFTVLELLIVIAIMCILIGLILVGLNAARSHARDEDKVTNIQTVVVGLTQFFDVCRSYPSVLDPNDPSATCSNLGNKTIADFIPGLDAYHFNQAGSDFHYAGLVTDTGSPLTDTSVCTNFHIGVDLEGTSDGFPTKSKFGPSNYPYGTIACTAHAGGSAATDFDGTSSSVFDIKK